MDNFNLKKFLAEGKLYEAMSPQDVVDIADTVAEEFTKESAEDGDFLIYTVGKMEGEGFELDTDVSAQTPDRIDTRGVGEGWGGIFRIKPSADGYEVRNAEKGGLVATIDGSGNFRMLSAAESRDELEGEIDMDWKNDEPDFNRYMEEGEDEPNPGMYIDDEEWEKEMGRMEEDEILDEGWKETIVGLGLTAATLAGGFKAFAPSPEVLADREKAQLVVNAQQDALEKSSDAEVNLMVGALEDAGIQIMGSYIKIAPTMYDKYRDNPEELDKIINQEKRKVIQRLLVKGNDKVKPGFIITQNGTLQWANPSEITPINEEKENKPSNKMKKSELKEMIKAAMLEDARTDAEQEGYKDGFEDAKDDIEDKLKKMKVSEAEGDMIPAEKLFALIARDLQFSPLVQDGAMLSKEDAIDIMRHVIAIEQSDISPEAALGEYIASGDLNEAVEKDVDVDVKDDENIDVDIEKDVEVDDEETEADIDVKASVSGESEEVEAVQGLLTKALEMSQALGDEKLEDQIGNTITYFTRAHVSRVSEMDNMDVNVNTTEMEAEMGLEEAKDEEVKENLNESVVFPMWNKIK